MSRLRVVFSIGSLHGGGAERQTVSLLRHLNRQQFEPILYLVYRAGTLLTEVPDDVTIAAFDERDTGWRRPGFLMHGRRVADLADFLKDCEADVCYDRTFLMTLIAAAAAQRVGVPNVSTIVTDPTYGFAPVAGRHQWLKRRMLRKLYSRSACVLANSEGAARSAERFYQLTPGLVTPLPNGVDVQQIQQKAVANPDHAWWMSPPTSGRRLFRIVTAGRLGEQKGFQLLIPAVQQLQAEQLEVEFRLAILGEGNLRPRLEAEIQQSGLHDRIQLPGFRQDAPAWYKTADLFVLPSFLEGMPNVLLEAMVCGTPVLSTDCPSGPREILGDSQFGALCAVGSVESLVSGIRKFVADVAWGQRYTSLAAARVTDSFSIQSAAKKLEHVLQAAAGQRSR